MGIEAGLAWICVAAAAVVFTAMIHSIATFGRTRDGAARSRGSSREVFWALIPVVIVIALAAPAVSPLVSPRAVPETAQESRPAKGPELAGELPQKAFHEGGIPL